MSKDHICKGCIFAITGKRIAYHGCYPDDYPVKESFDDCSESHKVRKDCWYRREK